MTAATPEPSPRRRERVARHVVARQPLREAISTWEREILALATLDPAVVEAVRLRAGRHHDCLT